QPGRTSSQALEARVIRFIAAHSASKEGVSPPRSVSCPWTTRFSVVGSRAAARNALKHGENRTGRAIQRTMQSTLLLWDIDGTLLHTDGAGMRAMARVAAALYGEAFSWEGIEASGQLDPFIFAQALSNNGFTADDDAHREFRERYIGE